MMFVDGILPYYQGIGKRIWFTVPRLSLINQTEKDLIKNGLTGFAVFQGNHWRSTYRAAEVALCSLDTINRRDKEKYLPPDIIVVDECHKNLDQQIKLSYRFPDARFIGMTATPQRSDGRGLGEMYGDMYISTKISTLIKSGSLCGYITHFPEVNARDRVEDKIKGVKINPRTRDYSEPQLGKAMCDQEIVGDAVKEWLRHANGLKTAVFCVNIAHAERQLEAYKKQGVNAGIIHSKMSNNECEKILSQFERGDILVLLSVGKISEGFDLPNIQCCQFLRHTKSLSLFLQQAGRGLRPSEGKEKCVMLDHVNHRAEFGPLAMPRHWTLKGRISTGFECPSCGTTYNYWIDTCMSCGSPMFLDDETEEEAQEELDLGITQSPEHTEGELAHSIGYDEDVLEWEDDDEEVDDEQLNREWSEQYRCSRFNFHATTAWSVAGSPEYKGLVLIKNFWEEFEEEPKLKDQRNSLYILDHHKRLVINPLHRGASIE